MYGNVVVTLRAEIAAPGRHGGNLVMGWTQTMSLHVPMGWTVETRGKNALVKVRPRQVKGLDLHVNGARFSLVGWLPGIAMPPKHRVGSSCMCESDLICVDARSGAPVCVPPSSTAMSSSL